MSVKARDYVSIMTARLQNIKPSHAITLADATNIVNFITLKKESLIQRKKGLRFLSSIAHQQRITADQSENLDVFAEFTKAGKIFKQKPLIVDFKNLTLNGSPGVIEDGQFFLEADRSKALGSFDPFEGTLAFIEATNFSSLITIELFDPILAVGFITLGSTQQTLMTDGRSLFKYTPRPDPNPDFPPITPLEPNYSYSVGKLDYTPPGKLSNLWWIKEVFLKSSEEGTLGKVLISSADLNPKIPIFRYDNSIAGTIPVFKPLISKVTKDNMTTEISLTSMKRANVLKGHTFASGVIQETMVTDEKGMVTTSTEEIDKRVVWSSAILDPTLRESWDHTSSSASSKEIDNPISDTAILGDSLIVATNRGFWTLTPSFADGESVNSEKFLDNFPAFPGFTNLSSRGVLYSVNTRGIFTIHPSELSNLSENAGVNVNPVLAYSAEEPFLNYFSLADQREGVYFFHSQEEDGTFSDKSVVYSIENKSFSFFHEKLTCGESVLIDNPRIFADFNRIGDLVFTRWESLRAGALEIVLGDAQGNIYTRNDIPGTGNQWFIDKSGTANPLLKSENPYYLQGRGFQTEAFNGIFRWNWNDPLKLFDENNNELSITDLKPQDNLGRWIVLEDMDFKSGQINTFPLKKRALLKEIRFFINNLTENGISGQFTVEAFTPQDVLRRWTIDLSKRRENYLFGKWVKTIVKTSGLSVGFRLYVSPQDKFSGKSRFEFDISSLQAFARY